MSKEEAIKILEYDKKQHEEELKIELEDRIDEPRIAYLASRIQAISTILNLIEKQQKQIEELNNIDEHFDNITPKEFDEKLEKYINAEYNKEFEDIFFDSELY